MTKFVTISAATLLATSLMAGGVAIAAKPKVQTLRSIPEQFQGTWYEQAGQPCDDSYIMDVDATRYTRPADVGSVRTITKRNANSIHIVGTISGAETGSPTVADTSIWTLGRTGQLTVQKSGREARSSTYYRCAGAN